MTTMIVLLLLLPLRRCRSLAAATLLLPVRRYRFFPLLAAIPRYAVSFVILFILFFVIIYIFYLYRSDGMMIVFVSVILLVGTTDEAAKILHNNDADISYNIKLTYYERIVFDASNVTINPSIKER